MPSASLKAVDKKGKKKTITEWQRGRKNNLPLRDNNLIWLTSSADEGGGKDLLENSANEEEEQEVYEKYRLLVIQMCCSKHDPSLRNGP